MASKRRTYSKYFFRSHADQGRRERARRLKQLIKGQLVCHHREWLPQSDLIEAYLALKK